jgi:hypothetical protein
VKVQPNSTGDTFWMHVIWAFSQHHSLYVDQFAHAHDEEWQRRVKVACTGTVASFPINDLDNVF